MGPNYDALNLIVFICKISTSALYRVKGKYFNRSVLVSYNIWTQQSTMLYMIYALHEGKTALKGEFCLSAMDSIRYPVLLS